MKHTGCGDFYGDESYFNSRIDIGDEGEEVKDNFTQESEGGYEDTSNENESENESGQSLDDCDGTRSDENESVNNSILYSPGGSNKLWKPSVAKEFMPDEQVTFESLTHAINMYRKYAEHAGFDVRLNTTTRFRHDKSIMKIKYVVFNRGGKIPDRSLDTMDTNNGGRKHRNSNFIVTDCKALINFERFSIGTNEFQIRVSRAAQPPYKEFIIRATTTNVGATKAHKLRAVLKGGYECVGPEESDYKDCRKKLGNIIGNKDVQLVVNKMNERKTYYPDYSFEYKCVDSVLNAMFWADETDKVFYKEFGDLISFDATLRTNK
ncbi:protein FAR-RED IMPAIRED RESPONSE 1-like [Lactuca sativa]|uniref:protein FAR-RED IMPAIRED RESPONSE 1-like n=1 Tax=Lactuca sativa TaxID=4236 RepID=UPI000CD9780B|nr:protein FAR-RED IMPAIRED RESPONSE 1-like [Lactuca sativa]